MRKSFVALALLVGAAAIWTTLAFAQDSRDEGVKLMNARMAQMNLQTRAARLGTSYGYPFGAADTMFVGHSSVTPWAATNPWHIGVGDYRPTSNRAGLQPGSLKYDGMWDFDNYDGGTIDSMQGWVPVNTPTTRSLGTIPDTQRPWQCLDWGNRLNAGPVQGRTPGIVSAWHVDNGVYPAPPLPKLPNSWTPLAGTASAWCGLRGW